MRHLVLGLLLLVGCEKAKAPPKDAKITDVLPASLTTYVRTAPKMFPVAGVIDNAFNTRDSACWKDFEDKLVATYQLQMETRHTSVFVLEGPLPREEVVACVKHAFARSLASLDISSDGELAVIDTGMGGNVYAAWRGPFVIVGDRQSVTEALAGPRKNTTWPGRIARLGTAPIALASTSPQMGALFGVPSTGFDMTLSDLSGAPGPVKLKGRVVLHCVAESDAQIGARHVAAGELRLPFELPPSLTAAIKRMRTQVTGADLELSFDESTWEGVDWEALAKLAQAITPAR